jgi:hypothetical protein
MNLDTELQLSSPTKRQWRNWREQDATLAELSYSRMRSTLKGEDQARKDEILCALVRVAQRDPTAAMLVTACLHPGLRHLVSRYGWSLPADEAWAVVVAAVQERVAGYDVDEQPGFVARNLLEAARQSIRRAVTVNRKWERFERNVDRSPSYTAAPDLSPLAMLAAGVDAGVITARDAWLIHATRVQDQPLCDAADQLGLSYDNAKARRLRAERRWRAWWEPTAVTICRTTRRKSRR